MESDSSTLIIIFIILLLFSSYFSATETAFLSMNRIRMKHLSASGNKKATQTLALVEDLDRVISTLLIGNNIVNIGAASVATLIFTRYYGNPGVTISTIVTTLLILVFSEISPKSLAKETPEKFAMFATPFLKFFIFLLMPLNLFFILWKRLLFIVFKFEDKQTITQGELITFVDEAENEGGIDSHESELIRSAIEFTDLDVQEILTPRVKVIAINENASIKEIKEKFITHGFSRLPVYQDTIDNIIGVINEKDFYTMLYHLNENIQTIIKPVDIVAPQMKISELLRRLQYSKSHLSVVVDEYGGTMGIVTMEDILEELVGEIWDEHDEIEEYYNKISDSQYIISGEADIEDFFDLFELSGDTEDIDAFTVGGWIVEQFGRIPEMGETLEVENLKITVKNTDARHVIEVFVEIIQENQNENKNEEEQK
ncbi:MAG: hemolysin family protein [Peptostreptococcales bacterium]|jgi:putative hemolysin